MLCAVFRRSVLVVVGLALIGLSGGVGALQTPGVTDTEVVLGAFVAQSGALAGVGIPVVQGAEAYYRYINDTQGGVHGRKIRFIACDDAFDPAKTTACVRKLVEEDRVFAIVNSLGTVPHLTVMDYLVRNNVPVVSPHANFTLFSKPVKFNYFAIQPNNEIFGTALARYAVQKLNARRVAIIYVDDAFGQELLGAAVAELRRNRLEPVLTVPHPGAETAFRPYVVRLQGANPDAVLMLTYLVPSASILKEAAAVAFKPKWLATNVQADINLVGLAGGAANVEGLIVTGFAVDPTLPDHPGATRFRDILRRYFPAQIPSGFSEIAYVGAMQVVEGLQRAGRALTRERFIWGLETLTNWTGDDLVPPITYARDDRRGITTLFMTKFEGGKLVFIESFSADPVGEPKLACAVKDLKATVDVAARKVRLTWGTDGKIKGNFVVTWGNGKRDETARTEAEHTYDTFGGYFATVTASCDPEGQDSEKIKINLLN
ncbi:MAG: ABC transporter substrate-binding protein [Candidatus Bipolaricaulota bacterium]|nr:ABC transporter substrate-binding protein [Candidatus Bipolaricaulota bacterium]MDW8110617.1 ABC transporter substrate-binding protein [Candidatus Bipolaricaulota bacterium]MDW8329850.1 ABC transporter substrate-binding protein [Candidatus Bipolaricaulota bacterium]